MLPNYEQIINGVEVKRPNSENEFGLQHNKNNLLINKEAIERSGDYIYSNREAGSKRFKDDIVLTNSRINKIKDVEKSLAEEQSAAAQLFNGLVMQGLIGEVAIGIPKAFSEIFDVVKTAASGDAMGSYANPLTQMLESWQDELRRNFAIYRENPDKAFDFTNPMAYIASNIPNMLTTVSLLIPSSASAKVLGLGVKGLGKLARMTKAANIIGKEGHAIYNTLNWINKTAKTDIIKNTGLVAKNIEEFGKAGAQAVFSRTIENFQEAREVYKNEYDNVLSSLNTMTEEELNEFYRINPQYTDKTKFKNIEDIAKDIAGLASNETFKKDYAMLLLDFMQFKSMSKALSGRFDDVIGVNAKRFSTQSAKGLTKEGAKILEDNINNTNIFGKVWNATKYYAKNPLEVIKSVPFSEGIEEMYQGIVSESSGDKINMMFDPNYTRRSIGSYLTDPHIWEQGLWGIIGGKAFEVTAKAGDKISREIEILKNKNLTKEQIDDLRRTQSDIQIEEIKGRKKKFDEFISNIQQINEGYNPYEFEYDTEGKLVVENGIAVNKKIDTSDTATMESLKKQTIDRYIGDLYLNAAFSGTASLLDDYINSAEFDKAFREVGAFTSEEEAINESIKQSYENIKNAYNSTIRDIYSNVVVENHHVAKAMISDILNSRFSYNSINDDIDVLQKSIDNIIQTQEDKDNVEQLEKEKFIIQAKRSINELDLEIQKVNKLFESKLIGKSSRDAKVKEINTRKMALINAIKEKQNNGLFNEEDINTIKKLNNLVGDKQFDENIENIYTKLNDFVTNVLQNGISSKVTDENLKRYVNEKINKEIGRTLIDSQIPKNAEQYKEIYDDFSISLDKLARDRYRDAVKTVENYIKEYEDVDEAFDNIIDETNLSSKVKDAAKIIKYGNALFGNRRTIDDDTITYQSILELTREEKRKRDKSKNVQTPGVDLSKSEQEAANETFTEVEKQINEQSSISTGEEKESEKEQDNSEEVISEEERKNIEPDTSYIQKEPDEKIEEDNYSHLTIPKEREVIEDSSYAELSKNEVTRGNSKRVLNNVVRNIIDEYRKDNNLRDILNSGTKSSKYEQFIKRITEEVNADARIIDEFKSEFFIKATIRNLFKDLKNIKKSDRYDKIIADISNELKDLSKNNRDDVMRYSVTESLFTDEELVEQFNSYIDHYLKANNYSVFTTADNQPVLNLRLLLENLINGKVFTESQIIDFVKKIVENSNKDNFKYYILDLDEITKYEKNYKDLLNDIRDDIDKRKNNKVSTADVSMRVDGSKGIRIKINGREATLNMSSYRNVISELLENKSNKIVLEYDYFISNEQKINKGIRYKIVDRNGNYYSITDIIKDENGNTQYIPQPHKEPSNNDIEVGYITLVEKSKDNINFKIKPLLYRNKVLNNTGFMWNVNENGCVDERINKLFNSLINSIDEENSENKELFKLLESLVDIGTGENRILSYNKDKDIIEKLLKHPLIQQLQVGVVNDDGSVGAFGVEGYQLGLSIYNDLVVQAVNKEGNLIELVGSNRENRLTAIANSLVYQINSILFHENNSEKTVGNYNAETIRDSINNFIFEVYTNYVQTDAIMQKLNESNGKDKLITEFGGYEKVIFVPADENINISSDKLEEQYNYSEKHPIVVVADNSSRVVIDGELEETSYNGADYSNSNMGIILGYKDGDRNKPIIHWISNKDMKPLKQRKGEPINNEKKQLYEAVKDEAKRILKEYINSDKNSLAYDDMAKALSQLFGGSVGKSKNILSGVNIMTKEDMRALLFVFDNKTLKDRDKYKDGNIVDAALLLSDGDIKYTIKGKNEKMGKTISLNESNLDDFVDILINKLKFNKSFAVLRPDNKNENKYFQVEEVAKGSNKLHIRIGSYEKDYDSYSQFLYSIGGFNFNLDIEESTGNCLLPVYRNNRTAAIIVDFKRLRVKDQSPVKRKDVQYQKSVITNKVVNSGDDGVQTANLLLDLGFTEQEIGTMLGVNEYGINLIPEIIYYDEKDTTADMKYSPNTNQIFITKRGLDELHRGGRKKSSIDRFIYRKHDIFRNLVHENIHRQIDYTGKLRNKKNVDDIIKTYISTLEYLNNKATVNEEIKDFINNYFKPVYAKDGKTIDIDATAKAYFEKANPDNENYTLEFAKRLFAEEWITESLTQTSLINYLQSLEYTENGKVVEVVKNEVIERDSIFKKIIDILLKIFNINLDNSKNNSIFARQYTILVRNINSAESSTVETESETKNKTKTTNKRKGKGKTKLVEKSIEFFKPEPEVEDDTETKEVDTKEDDIADEYYTNPESNDENVVMVYDRNAVQEEYYEKDEELIDLDEDIDMYSATRLLISAEEFAINNDEDTIISVNGVLPATNMEHFLDMFPSDIKPSIAENIENGNIKYVCK